MSTASVGVLALAEVRPALAVVLAPEADGDAPVHIDYPDALDPPCLLVLWGDPWLDQPRALGSCVLDSHVDVLCVAGRVEPGAGVEVLEDLVAGVVARVRDAGGYALTTVGTPREYIVAGVNYLGARVAYRVPAAV